MFYLADIYSIFQPLIDVNEAILKFWHHTVGLSWGASIIGLTAVIRLAILPLTFKGIRSMQSMQRLQPEMKKLQARYKDDKQRLNQEMMKFYKEHKVNPFGSCLPLLLQLPFFFSLYGLQRSAHFKFEVHADHGERFFAIPDITQPLTNHLAVLIPLMVLYVATQLASSLVTAVNIQDKNQRRLMLALPFVFVVVVINFPAGLLIYWITTNVWTIGQQLFVKRFLPPPEPHGAPEPKKSAADPKAQVDGRARAEGKSRADGKPERAAPARAGALFSRGSGVGADVGSGAANGGPTQKAPPPSPRKRKKRSGRRR